MTRCTTARPARRRLRATVMVLIWAVLGPASQAAPESRPLDQAVLWETFSRSAPGTLVLLVLRDGEHVEGRLLAVAADAAEVVDTAALGLSPREQRRLVRDLLEERRRSPGAAGRSKAALARRVAREDVAAVYVAERRSGLARVLKGIAMAAGVYFLAMLVVFAVVGVPST